MKKLFTFKKLSAQIAFLVGVMVLIVAGGVAGYMETRIISEIGRHSRLGLQYQMTETAEECNTLIYDAAQRNARLPAAEVTQLLSGVKVYDTGCLLLRERGGAFTETNDFIKRLSAGERNGLIDSAGANPNEVFEIGLGGVTYLAASTPLFSEHDIFILAPKSEVNAEVTASLIRFIMIFVVAYGLVLVVAYFVGKNMGKPIAALSTFMQRAGRTGDISYAAGERQALSGYMKKGDEIGHLIKDCDVFLQHIYGAANELEAIANGDLTVEIEKLSDKDTMAGSLNKMIANLNNMFSEVIHSAVQVSGGSKQIADGAAALSQGTSEQSAAIDEFSTSILKIREQTGKNAAIAQEAADMSDAIRSNAEKGSEQMNSMMKAVTEINDASNQIGKVIKVIDDIAFQTNILALNAAVEAARAGQHGKGFAVVAEEVRSLAAKSAEAAKDTGGLIENTVAKAHLGMDIATQTAQSLNEIVEGVVKSAGIIGNIAHGSDGQLEAIDHLNAGIGQVSHVIQQNSAAAEESAAASAEMNAQANVLEDLIAQFKLKNNMGHMNLLM